MRALNRTLRRFGVLASAAGMLIAVVAATSSAATSGATSDHLAAPTFASQVRAQVQDLVAANPGARQVDANTVKLANGVVATAVPASSSCPYKYLCIYPQTYWNGPGWNLYNCGFVNIGNAGWSNKMRSYMNEQTEGTVSIFYDWNASSKVWVELGASSSYDAQGAPTWLDSTDGIHVC